MAWADRPLTAAQQARAAARPGSLSKPNVLGATQRAASAVTKPLTPNADADDASSDGWVTAAVAGGLVGVLVLAWAVSR